MPAGAIGAGLRSGFFRPCCAPFLLRAGHVYPAMWGLQCKVQRVQVDHNLSDVIKGRTLCRPRARSSLSVQLSVQFFCPVLLYWPARNSHSNAHCL